MQRQTVQHFLVGWCQASRHQLDVGQVLAFIAFFGLVALDFIQQSYAFTLLHFDATWQADYIY